MYAPRDRSSGHESLSEGHSMSGSHSTGNQPLISQQVASAAATAAAIVDVLANPPEPRADNSGEESAGTGPAPVLPALPPTVMAQVPGTGITVSFPTPQFPPSPPPHDRLRPRLDRANTGTSRRTAYSRATTTRPVSFTERDEMSDSPVSTNGRHYDQTQRSPANDPSQQRPPMMGRESGLTVPPALEHRHTRKSVIDFAVPTVYESDENDEDEVGPRTVRKRMYHTMRTAKKEEIRYTRKALLTGYALNIAIGLQILLSALITALSAVTSGKHTQVMTSVLGGAGTIVASYLARARGSGEPDTSNSRVKDLQQFRRECKAFIVDHGNEDGDEHDQRVEELRRNLEYLLGNYNGPQQPPAVFDSGRSVSGNGRSMRSGMTSHV